MLAGVGDQLRTNASALMGVSHSEVGEIPGPHKVGQRARDADEQLSTMILGNAWGTRDDSTWQDQPVPC